MAENNQRVMEMLPRCNDDPFEDDDNEKEAEEEEDEEEEEAEYQ